MGLGYYSLSKAAMNGLTQCLATEMAGMNIRVNAIAPGPIDTEATRTVVPKEFLDHLRSQLLLPRLGEPTDLVGMCLFLLSDDASWVTGQIFAVDGGQTRRL
jgi:NAD(P)-dependent dehydrogenase (short-subunit alcohol dehydrogenase family)